jgi:uncharacterized membrane protein YczE
VCGVFFALLPIFASWSEQPKGTTIEDYLAKGDVFLLSAVVAAGCIGEIIADLVRERPRLKRIKVLLLLGALCDLGVGVWLFGVAAGTSSQLTKTDLSNYAQVVFWVILGICVVTMATTVDVSGDNS